MEEKVLWTKQMSVALLTNKGRAYNLCMHRKTTRRTADAIVSAVAARNPDVLVGLTRENQRLYPHDIPNAKQIVIRPWLGFFIGITGYFIVRLVLDLLLD